MINQIDPFLYRSDSPMKRWQKYYKNKGETNFQQLLNEKKASQKNLNEKISSNQLNQIPNRNEILAHAKGSSEHLKLYEAAKEFESFFIEKTFQEMKKNIPKNSLFHGGRAEEIFDGMLLTERVKKLSDNTHFGLAEMIYKQLQNIRDL